MIEVRRATVDDADLLARQNAWVHDLHVEAEPTLYRPTNLGELSDLLRARLAEPHRFSLIAEVDGGSVGHVVAEHIVRERSPYTHPMNMVHVHELAVSPAHRDRGIGRALMDATDAEARKLGATRVELDVRAHNDAAREFYERLGYSVLGVRMARVFT